MNLRNSLAQAAVVVAGAVTALPGCGGPCVERKADEAMTGPYFSIPRMAKLKGMGFPDGSKPGSSDKCVNSCMSVTDELQRLDERSAERWKKEMDRRDQVFRATGEMGPMPSACLTREEVASLFGEARGIEERILQTCADIPFDRVCEVDGVSKTMPLEGGSGVSAAIEDAMKQTRAFMDRTCGRKCASVSEEECAYSPAESVK
ncbi:MAG: hypothetical protein WC651_00050 [Candidatus Gracilibacteria bacterium]|jgi:hypothetical protein